MPAGAIHERVEARQGLRQVLAAESDPEMVARVPELRPRQEQHALGLDEIGRELVDRDVARQAREPDRAASRAHPREAVGPASEEVVEHGRGCRRRSGSERPSTCSRARRPISARISDGAAEQIVV